MTFLYRYYDSGGGLLYVTLSGNAPEAAAWFWQVRTITVRAYTTRSLALNERDRALQNERPLFNIYPPPAK